MTRSPDRRCSPRAPVAMTAGVLARFNDGVAATIESISTAGARLVGPLTVEPGERIRIVFQIEGQSVEVVGDVVRVHRSQLLTDHIAVRFVNVGAQARTAIRRLVEVTLDLCDED